MTWLARQPCLCCGVRGVVLHHLAAWGLPRKLRNPVRDYTVAPICPRHHDDTGGRHAAHRMAQEAWLRHWGCPDPDALLLGYYRAYSAAHGLCIPAGLAVREVAEWLRDGEGAGAPT